jgi:hypothetical protein
MGQFVDRTGLRYGRLKAVKRDESQGPASKGKRVRWICRCDCGTVTSATGHELAAGHTASCGCLQRDNVNTYRTHGLSKTPTYWSWQAAKSRCYNKRNAKFAFYGGAGISMAPEWVESFDRFLADMGVRPKGKTLDRIDPHGNYEPGNCRWATPLEQVLNQRKTVLHEWRGSVRTVKEIAELEGLPRTSLNKKYNQTKDIGRAVAHVRSRLGRTGQQNLNPPRSPHERN